LFSELFSKFEPEVVEINPENLHDPFLTKGINTDQIKSLKRQLKHIFQRPFDETFVINHKDTIQNWLESKEIM